MEAADERSSARWCRDPVTAFLPSVYPSLSEHSLFPGVIHVWRFRILCHHSKSGCIPVAYPFLVVYAAGDSICRPTVCSPGSQPEVLRRVFLKVTLGLAQVWC